MAGRSNGVGAAGNGTIYGHSYASSTRRSRRRSFCSCCVSLAKWVPVIFISSVVCWSYYAYVVELCLLSASNAAEQTLMLVFYHFFFTLFVWAYYQTVFNSPGGVPKRFLMTSEELESVETAEDPRVVLEQMLVRKDLPCVTRSFTQEVRYCSECCLIKPDRAHHCSVCGKCVLKVSY